MDFAGRFGEAFSSGEFFGLGLSDQDFFAQTAALLSAAEHPFMVFLISLSNHHPYSLAWHIEILRSTTGLSGLGWATICSPYTLSMRCSVSSSSDCATKGILDQWVLVVYGDHEAFWEEVPDLGPLLQIAGGDLARMWKARKTLALMIRLPGAAHAGVERSPAGQLDIAPTVLSLLGIDRSDQVMLGRDLTGDADALVVLRDGSFVTGDRISIEAGRARGCYALSTLMSSDCPPAPTGLHCTSAPFASPTTSLAAI